MSHGSIQKGDIGSEIELHLYERDELTNKEAPVDLTGFTLLEIDFRKADHLPIETKTATVVGALKNGVIKYITESGFVDIVGEWKLQAHIAFGSMRDFKSRIGRIEVRDNI